MESNGTVELQSLVHLNGREISREDFARQQEAAAKQKGVDLKEVSKDDFKMRLKG